MKRAAVALLIFGGACAAPPPDDVARDYVVACEHGHPRAAYALVSLLDRDVRAFRDFQRSEVRNVDDRADRILARRTKVKVRTVEADSRQARVYVETKRVDVSEGSHRLLAAELEDDGAVVASRLRRLDLPIRTSTATLNLRREAGQWRVFLDLATRDERSRRDEVARLKQLGRRRLASGQFGWARETYESAQRLAPGDRAIEHALSVLSTLGDQQAQAERQSQLARAYRTKIVVDGVRVRNNRITGEVRNTGDQPLAEVELTITGLDGDGLPITEVTAYPVRVSASRVGKPLLAGHARRFESMFESPPRAWKGAVEVRVTQIRFHVTGE